MNVRYFGGQTEVRLGDRVESSLFWILKRRGKVTYVPGISPKQDDFEHHGLRWVGILTDQGTLFGTLVDPQSNTLLRRVKFLHRDDSTTPAT